MVDYSKRKNLVDVRSPEGLDKGLADRNLLGGGVDEVHLVGVASETEVEGHFCKQFRTGVSEESGRTAFTRRVV